MQSNSSSTDTNLPPPFVCACQNKTTFKSGSSVVEGHHQTPSGGGGGGGAAAPGTIVSGELSAITIMAAATELTLKIPPSKFHPSGSDDHDDNLAGLVEFKLGNGLVKSEAPRTNKSYRHHPYDHKGWLSIAICGGSSSSKSSPSPGGGSSSSSETTASSERTISDPNLIINHGENNGVEVCSSERTISDPNLIINNHDDDDDLDLRLGVRVYDEVDLELRLKSWI